MLAQKLSHNNSARYYACYSCIIRIAPSMQRQVHNMMCNNLSLLKTERNTLTYSLNKANGLFYNLIIILD